VVVADELQRGGDGFNQVGLFDQGGHGALISRKPKNGRYQALSAPFRGET
jgi:hypothetical protein